MRALLYGSVAVSCAYLGLIVTQHANGSPLSVVLKVASIGLLVVFASASHLRSKLLILALAFSAAGDLFLEIRHLGGFDQLRLFLLGLLAFLIAHVFYVALFVKNRLASGAARGSVVIAVNLLACAAVTLAILWPGLAEMRGPVLGYSAVLTAVAIAAQFTRYSRRVAAGALLFFASDTMLAMDVFGHPFRGARALVWVTYFAAQFLITTGVLATPKRPSNPTK